MALIGSKVQLEASVPVFITNPYRSKIEEKKRKKEKEEKKDKRKKEAGTVTGRRRMRRV